MDSPLQRTLFSLASRIVPRRAAEYFYRNWGRTRRYPLPESEVAAIESAVCRSLPFAPDRHIETYRWGQGPVALLVHGWHGRASQYWAVIEHLRLAGYKVVAFDAPGHGRSSGDRYDLLEMTAAVERVAAQYGEIELVVAHSFGCLAAAGALVDGARFHRVTFVAPPASLRRATDTVLDAVGMSQRARAIFIDKLEQRYGRNIWRRYDFAAIGRDIAPRAQFTVIHDVDDREVDWRQGKQVSDHLPGSRFIRTEGLGHRRILRSERLCELIEDHGAGLEDIKTRLGA
ncbi:MAG: alpha/beta hydrolase [Pseudomonadota bacterium]